MEIHSATGKTKFQAPKLKKHQIPNPKFQIKTNIQYPRNKIIRHSIFRVWVIGFWSFEIICDLEFGVNLEFGVWNLCSDPVVFSGVICYTRIKPGKRREP